MPAGGLRRRCSAPRRPLLIAAISTADRSPSPRTLRRRVAAWVSVLASLAGRRRRAPPRRGSARAPSSTSTVADRGQPRPRRRPLRRAGVGDRNTCRAGRLGRRPRCSSCTPPPCRVRVAMGERGRRRARRSTPARPDEILDPPLARRQAPCWSSSPTGSTRDRRAAASCARSTAVEPDPPPQRRGLPLAASSATGVAEDGRYRRAVHHLRRGPSTCACATRMTAADRRALDALEAFQRPGVPIRVSRLVGINPDEAAPGSPVQGDPGDPDDDAASVAPSRLIAAPTAVDPDDIGCREVGQGPVVYTAVHNRRPLVRPIAFHGPEWCVTLHVPVRRCSKRADSVRHERIRAGVSIPPPDPCRAPSHAQPDSPYRSPNRRRLKLNETAALLRDKGEPVIHLGGGEPKNKAPIDAILSCGGEAQHGRRAATRPPDGMPALKKAIIRYTEEHYDQVVGPENVIVSCGAKQADHDVLLTRSSNPQDEVIFPAPYWVSYPEMVKTGRRRAGRR
ncbi:MAG: aminotransferase class I/II-fold pyridoxal phosphate-dependent enzyme [Comamonadaceae bacterium]|nr:aminotransferase class I/II-fold pyridoxal phosphate-dependent enzyme [Comamonadaceae bacterium]